MDQTPYKLNQMNLHLSSQPPQASPLCSNQHSSHDDNNNLKAFSYQYIIESTVRRIQKKQTYFW